MASPCEVLMQIDDEHIAMQMLNVAVDEARRIEQKYSRFLKGNILWQINNAQGNAVNIDQETAQLLQFSQQCYQLSGGSFDITAGPLINLWRFDGSNQVPKEGAIKSALRLVGFSAIGFTDSKLNMPASMSLDFGGIGKEYAVDRVAQQLSQRWPNISVMVNFGGDIACPVLKVDGWQVGIENPQKLDNAAAQLTIRQGALATSGTTRRYFEVDSVRYGHIINPQTGYPVDKAPLSVTVLGPNCITAGMLSTMAMLKGADSEGFLAAQNVDFKVFR
ncbi:FAD:protein FMN transferase [uncultured Shewanella sp.]|uniref:FAD:protein FMN transferase n=1 Tax=uncultured Shewanella sp. TaxID=173975 RepID=UPI002618FA3E|nr:FAD:protein FMN transferase [uncultured Shewanella sp.]